jgi:hypothetical protein
VLKENMRLILRIVGTWLLGIGLVLVIVDGIKSLAGNTVVLTSLSALWTQFTPQSLTVVQGFVSGRLFGAMLEVGLNAVLACPAFLVFGVPGVILAFLGRSRQGRRYVTTDPF